jgi:hypothetical protein
MWLRTGQSFQTGVSVRPSSLTRTAQTELTDSACPPPPLGETSCRPGYAVVDEPAVGMTDGHFPERLVHPPAAIRATRTLTKPWLARRPEGLFSPGAQGCGSSDPVSCATVASLARRAAVNGPGRSRALGSHGTDLYVPMPVDGPSTTDDDGSTHHERRGGGRLHAALASGFHHCAYAPGTMDKRPVPLPAEPFVPFRPLSPMRTPMLPGLHVGSYPRHAIVAL